MSSMPGISGIAARARRSTSREARSRVRTRAKIRVVVAGMSNQFPCAGRKLIEQGTQRCRVECAGAGHSDGSIGRDKSLLCDDPAGARLEPAQRRNLYHARQWSARRGADGPFRLKRIAHRANPAARAARSTGRSTAETCACACGCQCASGARRVAVECAICAAASASISSARMRPVKSRSRNAAEWNSGNARSAHRQATESLPAEARGRHRPEPHGSPRRAIGCCARQLDGFVCRAGARHQRSAGYQARSDATRRWPG